MSYFDLPLDQLRDYAPAIDAPKNFHAFWAETVHAAAERAVPVSLQRVDSGLRTVETFDVTFSGFNGEPIRAWLHLPTVRREPLGCVVQYIGYSGGRGLPHQWTLWASAGYAHLVMDTVFAAYNAYRGEKKILEYPFNNHEGGGVFQEAAALTWVRERLGD